MASQKATQEKFNQLRRQAEELMISNNFITPPAVTEDPLRLIHELQTSQLELELQNEELIRYQQELIRFQRKYTDLYDFAPVGYITLNPKGRILEANLAFADMLSIEKTHLIDHPFSTHIVSEDQDIYFHHLRNISDFKTRQVCKLRLEKKDGTIFHAQLESIISTEDEVNPEQYRTIVMDVSERHRMEAALAKNSENLKALVDQRTAELQQRIARHQQTEKDLKESQELFSLFMDYLPALVFIKDEKSRILYVNKQMTEVLGAKEWIGKTPQALFSRDIAQRMVINDKKTMAQGYQESQETIPDKNGINHIYQTFKFKIHRQGNSPLLGGINLDISKIKKAEAERLQAHKIATEQRKQALVGEIAGKIAHDFNNILGIIMGNTELSLLDCKEEETQKTLRLIFDQTIRGKNLTKNLVAFAKSNEPRQVFFDISKKIDLVLNLMKSDLKEIKLQQEQSLVPQLLADPGMIEHALVNLVQNSIHALSRTQNPRIIIRTYTRDNSICLEVEDNGCGIPKEHIAHIYDPSFTLKGSRDLTGSYHPHIKGTGYGMSNVKKYIEQHRGSVFVASESGLGTTVTIMLPIVKKELTGVEKEEIRKTPPHSGRTILLVEDEPDIAEVQYKILTQAPCKHKVDIARTGQAAMDLFDRNDYDFISLDYVLSGHMNGMDVYNHIRNTDKNVPILFVSGNIDFLQSIRELKQTDAHIDHLPKPCSNKDYIDSINELLEKHKDMTPVA